MLRSNLLQNRRGLATVVGTIFFVVIAASIVGYVTYNMNVISIISESIQTKQSINYERNTEEFEVVKVGTVNNKFNFTLQNTGNIPVNVTRLWVKNTTDSAWPASKFNINTAIAPGATITNVGQNIGLTALSTQSYIMKLVTERGSSQKLFLNSVGGESLYLKLHAAPTAVATGFTTTLILEVINTGTNQLLNLQSEMDSVVTSCGATCSHTKISGPDPTTFSSLVPGDVATFEWVYSLTGDNNDQFTFTTSLVNGIDTDSTTVSVQAVQFAENAEVSLTAAGLVIPSIDDSILLFHQETFDVPASTPPNVTYQMYSATPDGGVDGTLVQLDTVLLSSFYTKNGTDTITVPAGIWSASLYLQSEAMPTSLIGEDEDLIFHFEDGQNVNPDNSEGDSTRDLEGCGGVGCSGWYDTDWSSRKQIVIKGSQIVGGPHTNFPVMVKLTNDADLASTAQADGDDILFTNNDGTVKLDHEIEYYSSGALVAWVEVPSLTSGADVAICMYYGNSIVASQENVAGTWSNGYEAVYHLHNDFTDSAKTHDGTNEGSLNVTGIAAGGQDFVPADEIELGTWSVSGSAITIEAWVNLDDTNQDDPRFVSKATGGGGTNDHVWMLGAGGTGEDKLRIRLKTGTSDTSGTTTLVAAGDDLIPGTWNLLALWYDGSNLRIYKDGAQVATTGKTGSLRVNSWKIVLSSDTSWASLDGKIDEVRISTVARSSGWMTTESNNLKDFSNFMTITSGGTGGTPDWQAGTGPHSSGSYYFDGINDCFRSLNNISGPDGNDIDAEPDTTALWFKTAGVIGGSDQYLVNWAGSGTCPSCDFYRIFLEANTGKIQFSFSTATGSDVTICKTTPLYDDGNWYHVTAVREGSGSADQCSMYVHDINGNLLTTETKDNSYGSDFVDADGKWHVGTSKQESGNWFDGWIDDVIHWNGKALTSAEATDLAKTNYGAGAHQLDVRLDITDSSGTFVSNVYDEPQTPIAFQDSKNLGDNNDAGYGIFNITMNLPQVIVSPQQRLNFSMNFVPATATWIPLELDMKIDDDTLSPYPSYLQIPKPDAPFTSYFTYNNMNEINVIITNSGNDGIYFIYTGTRFNFNGTNGAYAGLIHRVNGTTAAFDVDSTSDSIYIPAGEKSELFFYIPTDQPSTTSAGTVIPPGIYRAAIWLHGYTDQGETFRKSIVLGSVNVVN